MKLDALEEERRLCYVALTRAKDYLQKIIFMYHLPMSTILVEYPLFKLGKKNIEVLNNDFNKAYKNYLENQLKSSFFVKKY